MSSPPADTPRPDGTRSSRRRRGGSKRPAWLTDRGVRTLVWSAPIMAILLIFAIKSLSMVATNSAGIKAYEQANYASSRTSFVQLGFLNVFERWVAPYNRGTAEYGLRDYDGARTSFEIALNRAPAEYDCRVRLNLVASIEGQADVLAGQQRHREAADRYDEGLRVLAEGDCGEPPAQEPTPNPSDSASPSPSDSGSPSPSDSGSPSPSDSGSPEPSDSGSPSQSPGDQPTDGGSTEPGDQGTGGPSGEPTSGGSGEPSPGDTGDQSPEERQQEEAQRQQEQQERLEEKVEQQRKQAEQTGDDPEDGETPSPPPSQDPADPADEQQRQDQLKEKSKDSQQAQTEGRDREGRPDQRHDTPW